MAKTLRDPTPSSAVARLLDREAANRALDPNAPITASPRESDTHTPLPKRDALSCDDTPRIKREFILTNEADDTFCELLALFRRTTRSRLTASQLFRAMLKASRGCLPALQYEAHQLGPLRLPGNGRDARAQREAFEERIAAVFVAGLGAAAALQASARESAPTQNRPGR